VLKRFKVKRICHRKFEIQYGCRETRSSAIPELRSQEVTRKDPKARQDRLSPSVAENSSDALSQPRYIVQPGDTLWRLPKFFLEVDDGRVTFSKPIA